MPGFSGKLQTDSDASLPGIGGKFAPDYAISTTDAINIFFKQVKLRHGLPFEVAIPNELTQKVLKETDDGKNIVRHENIDDMFKNLGI